jgi:DNA-binding transcriptional regulator YhcF (GntR family)
MTHTGRRTALHPAITEKLRTQLYEGVYEPYERLPTTRTLAQQFHVSQATMSRALQALVREGLLWVSNTGTFVTAVALGAVGSDTSARAVLASFSIPEDAVNGILNLHAHELAEKQREWLKFQGYGPDEEPCPCGGCSWCLAQDYIDHIDPKAQP